MDPRISLPFRMHSARRARPGLGQQPLAFSSAQGRAQFGNARTRGAKPPLASCVEGAWSAPRSWIAREATRRSRRSRPSTRRAGRPSIAPCSFAHDRRRSPRTRARRRSRGRMRTGLASPHTRTRRRGSLAWPSTRRRRGGGGGDGSCPIRPTSPGTGGLDPDEDAVVRLVWRLPARQRQVIALRILLDLSIADTAEIMGVASGT